MGPFHRQESPTQTVEDARNQTESQEVWGRTPRGGMCPTVQAYPGAIAAAIRGIEFHTEVHPNPGSSPLEARWYLDGTVGVQMRTDANGTEFACISANVINHQPRV